MSIAVYIRVSTYSQNAESQKAEISRWLDAHGHHPNTVTWFEDKESGSHTNRSGYSALSEAIFAGTIKTVVVWKLDRLSRSMVEGINILGAWCEHGVRVVSVTQQIDLSGTVGRLVAGVLFATAEMELENTKERQAVGIELAKKNGVYTGRKQGTTKAKPTRAKELHAKGLTHAEIATTMHVSERTIYRYLK